MTDWRTHLLETEAAITDLLDRTHTVAVLGIKTRETGAPAHFVPAYAQRAGMRVIPVPVYHPEVTAILGEPVFRTISAIGERVDLVNVFRRAHRIPEHLDDIIAAAPGAVWFQSGIRNDEAAERLARAGIDVVQDRCLMIDLQERGR
jgi:predicted CoA-binding protein